MTAPVFNQWFLGLPEERQAVLREDKWMLAEAAYNAAQAEIARLTAERDTALAGRAEPVAQCCMCGKRGLSTEEDGGPECELSDGRWVCSRECYERAVEPQPVTVQDAARVPEIAALIKAAKVVRRQIDGWVTVSGEAYDALDSALRAIAGQGGR